MAGNLVARAVVEVPASADEVWSVLVDPSARWMVGSRVSSTYVVGDPITFDGEWEGTPFQDHGEIVEVDRPRLLRYTHYSPLSGQPDVPESYHHLTFMLEESDGSTTVTLEQDGNGSTDEVEHAEGLWRQVLDALAASVAPDAHP
ncbi:SRPBCC domain-containing protein [Cellulomonas sp. URHD0024]|uniref:SRPBCC family protein n=1 Tax=Cellulomonas sp. URHD0024 TaxID=1302620 RepID=UPI00042497E8|nr:SRPBCC domain-containing protein [Cellulomonas sp. URHD0024]